MKLLMDIGNSRVKWKCHSNEIESQTKNIAYQSTSLITQLDNDFAHTEFHISKVYISNVAGDEIKSKVYQWVADRFNVEPEFAVSLRESCGLISAYQQANQLGVDRFLAMIGAQTLNNKPKVVVDSGTATTIDCINSNHKFMGGVILPGLDLMRISLSSGADALDTTGSSTIMNLFATDTDDAILSGAKLATVSAIEVAVKNLSDFAGCEADCIITGGNGKVIESHLNIGADYQPDLVLKGLLEYFRAK